VIFLPAIFLLHLLPQKNGWQKNTPELCLRCNYDPDRKNLSSLAFRPSSDCGISVISRECIELSGSSVCGHIARFYKSISGEPPIFWEIPEDILPANCRNPAIPGMIVITIWSASMTAEARSIIKLTPLSEVSVCLETGEHRPLTETDLLN
jgi:hypothetical protein